MATKFSHSHKMYIIVLAMVFFIAVSEVTAVLEEGVVLATSKSPSPSVKASPAGSPSPSPSPSSSPSPSPAPKSKSKKKKVPPSPSPSPSTSPSPSPSDSSSTASTDSNGVMKLSFTLGIWSTLMGAATVVLNFLAFV